jgi:hypothetical protein
MWLHRIKNLHGCNRKNVLLQRKMRRRLTLDERERVDAAVHVKTRGSVALDRILARHSRIDLASPGASLPSTPYSKFVAYSKFVWPQE